MTHVASAASWERAGDSGIRLTGSWALLLDADLRRRMMRELRALESPREHAWDLTHVDALDSAGARVLWDVWGHQLPERLECHADYQHWFRRLADTHLPEAPAPTSLNDFARWLGARITGMIRTAGGILLLVGQLMLDVGYCIRHPRITPWKGTATTIYHVGATSMLLLGIVGFLIGVVMAIQIGMSLKQFGASQMIVGMMGLSVLRELGPVICGIILAGRSGSAMTAGIGSMHLTGEYDALRAFGISPSLRLALPRVLGAGISVPLLVVWTDLAALVGGGVAAQSNLGVGLKFYLTQLPEQVQIVNFWIGLSKGALFGLTIAIVSCYFGMTAAPDTASLSRHTTLAVVTSLVLILLFDASSGALLTNVGLL